MYQPPRMRTGLALMGPAAQRRLEFTLGVLPGPVVWLLMDQDTRKALAPACAARRLHLRGAHAPLLVTGGKGSRFSCYSQLWQVAAPGEVARSLRQVHVSGSISLPELELLPDLLTF